MDEPSCTSPPPGVGGRAPDLVLELLRGFQARLHGRVIEFPRAAQRVIAFLALHERPVQRAHVAGTLWIDSSEEHAQAALRTALWRIRQRAGDVVTTSSACIGLGNAVVVDLHVARACAERALQSRAAPDDVDMAALCDDGDLLPDWYEDWLTIEREHFRQLRLLALDALCEHLNACGRYREAVVAGLASVKTEPLRETAHRGLILAHLAADNPGEALRAYELFRALLHDRLGLAPSPALQALVADL